MRRPHNSELTLGILFCTMNRVNRYMKVVLMIFQKNIFLEQLDHFGHENEASP